MEPLLPHFLQFYEDDEQLTPPLKLEAVARAQVGARRCGLAWPAYIGRGQALGRCVGALPAGRARVMVHQI